jgi:xanthine dehydrogenase YagS FAD-binding subunit
MQSFEYMAPTSVAAAIQALGTKRGLAEILAGGTDQMSLMKERIHTPTRLVSLRNISELRGISASGRGVRIGATATIAELLGSNRIAGKYNALTQAAEGVSSPQMRSMGTVGGDLLQRPRCWYFRNGFGLLGKDATGKSLAPQGENQYHAILGNKGPAYFVSASSFGPALIALGAKVKVQGPEGAREIDASDLFQIPGNDQERETSLAVNEVLAEITLPDAAKLKTATYEVRQRKLMDWPLATASVALEMDGNNVKSARIVMGHVAPIPWRSPEAERALAGKSVSEQSAAAAGKAAVAAATPLSRNKHKVRLAEIAVKRAILRAAGKEVA